MFLTQDLNLKKFIVYFVTAVIAVLSLLFLIFKPKKRRNLDEEAKEILDEIDDSEAKIEDLTKIEEEKIKEIEEEDISVEDALKYLEDFLRWTKQNLMKITKRTYHLEI